MGYSTQELINYLIAVLSGDKKKVLSTLSSDHLFHTAGVAVEKDKVLAKQVGEEAGRRLEANGWVNDPDLGWVIKTRLQDCFLKKVVVVENECTMFKLSHKYSINQVVKYLTDKSQLKLMPKVMELTIDQRNKSKQRDLVAEVADVFV